VSGSGGGGGGGGNATFSIPNFGGSQVATAVLTYEPASTTGAATTSTLTAARASASGRKLAGRVTLEDLGLQRPHRDLPESFVRATRERIESLVAGRSGASLRGEAPPRAKYTDAEIGVNGTATFKVTTSGSTITARKMLTEAQTTHCYVFAELVGGNPVISTTQAQQIAAAFDTSNSFDPAGMSIYDRVTSTFGFEWRFNPLGGRDGDTKVVLLILSSETINFPGESGLFGFFYQVDEFDAADFPESNEAEIIYMNADSFTGDMYDGLATIAHEFQHMVNFNQKFIRDGAFPRNQEEDTINEGLSVLAEADCGFDLDSPGGGNGFLFQAVRSYLQSPGDFPFFEFTNRGGDYGKGYMLMQYIQDRFGVATITTLATSSSVGRDNLASATGVAFNSLFRDWALTNLIDPLSGAPFIYTYSSFNTNQTGLSIRGLAGAQSLPGVQPQRSMNPPNGTASLSLSPYEAGYVEYSGGDGSTLEITVSQGGSGTANLIHQSPDESTFSSLQ
jgi:hypothetical protein